MGSSTALRESLGISAHEVTDVSLPGRAQGQRWRAAIGLAFSLAVIAGFFVFQACAQSIPGGTLLVALSMVVEFALLAAAHAWENRG